MADHPNPSSNEPQSLLSQQSLNTPNPTTRRIAPTPSTYETNSPRHHSSILRPAQADSDRVLSESIVSWLGDVGYDTSPSRSRFDTTAALFFYHQSTPVARLEALMRAFVTEIRSLMPHVKAQSEEGDDAAVKRWKEQTLTMLIGSVMPAMTMLLDGLSGEITEILGTQGGEVRLGGGDEGRG
jgi:hypothetical protein